MRQFLIAVVSAAAVSGCSGSREERRVLSIDSTLDQPDLTLPDTVTRRDTSVALATRSEPPASVEPKAVKREASPTKPSAPARRKARRASVPKASTADTSVQAYAPGVRDSTPEPEPRVKPDSAASESDTVVASADTVARARATRADSTRSLTRDTLRPPADTAQVAASSPSSADTMTTSPIETATPSAAAASPSVVDTVARADTAAAPAAPAPVARPAPTAARVPRPADTTSTPRADTTVASPAAGPPAEPSRSAADLAARTLPVGTEIHAQLDDSITSRRDTVGQIISAHVMENVIGPNGRTLIAAGAPVRFTITRLRPSRSKGSQGRLGLRVDSIALNGQLETVQAETRPIPRELRGRGAGEDAAKVGGGAAAGAVIGGVVGKTKGAVIGGVAGAAAGAVLATQTKTRDVVVKAKTPVVFVLTAPLVAP